MKSLSSTFRRLLPLLGVAAIASVLPSIAQAQVQNVTVNGSTVCAAGSGPSMSIDPSGNLTITCSGGGGTPTAPSCVVPTVTVTQGATQMATVTASCTGSPDPNTGYAWTAGTGSPFPATAPTTQSFQAGPFPNLGSFTYFVVATNSVGSSTQVQGTVNVVAPGTCTATTVASTFPDSFQQPLVAIPKLGSVSYQLPALTISGKKYTFSSVQSLANTSGPNPLPIQIAITKCPGDFSTANVLPNCSKYGYADTGATQLPAYAGTAPKGTYCSIPLGSSQTYYVSVRAVDPNNTFVCRGNTCYMLLTYQPGS